MKRGSRVKELAEGLRAKLDVDREAISRELDKLVRIQTEAPDAVLEDGRWVSTEVRRMVSVELERADGGCEPRHDDPRPVYARPLFRLGEVTIHYRDDYEVAVTVPGHVEVGARWATRMRADGLPESVIAACAEALQSLDELESGRRRRFDASERRGICEAALSLAARPLP